jgi:hypothetical protein
MITNFKIFENKKLYEYINNFIVINNTIGLCTEARFVDVLSKKNVFIRFDCFDFDKNNKIDFEAYGDHETFPKEDLNKLTFLTPSEFYNKYTEICINLYERIRNDLEGFDFTEGDGGWYPKQVKNYKRALDTIPEFEHYTSAEKYNL